MNATREVKDFVLELPELYGQHSSINVAGVAAAMLKNFRVDKGSVVNFVPNSAYNNNTAVANLADLYSFVAPEGRLRCCHILNLGVQVIVIGQGLVRVVLLGGTLGASLTFGTRW
jgi:hypothetical protein